MRNVFSRIVGRSTVLLSVFLFLFASGCACFKLRKGATTAITSSNACGEVRLKGPWSLPSTHPDPSTTASAWNGLELRQSANRAGTVLIAAVHNDTTYSHTSAEKFAVELNHPFRAQRVTEEEWLASSLVEPSDALRHVGVAQPADLEPLRFKGHIYRHPRQFWTTPAMILSATERYIAIGSFDGFKRPGSIYVNSEPINGSVMATISNTATGAELMTIDLRFCFHSPSGVFAQSFWIRDSAYVVPLELDNTRLLVCGVAPKTR